MPAQVSGQCEFRHTRRLARSLDVSSRDLMHVATVATLRYLSMVTRRSRACAMCKSRDSGVRMHHACLLSRRVFAVRTPGQRGRVGQWLVDERTARGWTQRQTLALLRGAGINVADSVYAAYESGTRVPQAGRLIQLEEFFGSQAERPAEPASLSDLLERLDRQAELMTDLIRELAAARTGQPEPPPSSQGSEARRALTRRLERGGNEGPLSKDRVVGLRPVP